jgi:large subunit ribosomal protein L6
MSRVGKKPITIPAKTTVTLDNGIVNVKGEKGMLSQSIPSEVDLIINEGIVTIGMNQDSRRTRALQGLTRSLVANMVIGVSQGFQRTLEINGIGYRAEVKGKHILFNLGYSHPIDFPLPEGISATVEKNTVVRLNGIDKQLLGLTAASIRQLRPPEPYKGKGIKYAEERIIRKAGKTGTK